VIDKTVKGNSNETRWKPQETDYQTADARTSTGQFTGRGCEIDRRIAVTLDSIVDMLASAVAAKLRVDLAGCIGSASIAPRLLSVDHAAVYLGRSKEAVQHMVAARKLPVVRDGRRVFLDVRELDRWIEQSTEPAET
jgi:excisionase family DNA binding protein